MSDEEKKVPTEEETPTRKNPQDDILDNVKEFLSSDEDDTGDILVDDAGVEELDELMHTKRSSISIVMFLIGMVVILGIVGYVLVNDTARDRVAGFIRGDLFKVEEQRAEALRKMYQDKTELLNEKYGDIRLQYFPRDAQVYIIQQLLRYDDISAKTPTEWGDPIGIDNETLHLKAGEELPYLSIENLPIREKGMMCPDDRQFYPASWQYCPGFQEKCREQAATETGPSDECTQHALRSVQYCPQDDTYYADMGTGGMLCPDGETAMDPAKVPIFVFRYNFLFERKDFLPQVISYGENDWKDLGSGKFIVQFPDHFALLRAWGPLKIKYEQARNKMRCWRLEWEDQWEEIKRLKVTKLLAEKLKEDAAEKKARVELLEGLRAPYQKAVSAVDVVRKVKNMATIRNGMAEIFYYCGELKKCDPKNMGEFVQVLGGKGATMADLGPVETGVYYGILEGMGVKRADWEGMDTYLASNPVEAAGLLCLQKWIPGQKEGEFKPVKDKDCLAALENIRTASPDAYTVYTMMFVNDKIAEGKLDSFKQDIEGYITPVTEYQGTEKYEDLATRVEASGRFVQYLIQAYLYAPDEMNDSLKKFAQSQQVNYRVDAEQRNIIPSEYSFGLRKAMEASYWTGSKLAFDEWYFRLWSQDVQNCLLFVKEHNKARYKKDLDKFEEMVGAEKEGLRMQAAAFRDYLNSLRRFEVLRQELKAANALYENDRRDFFEKYPDEKLETLKTTDPDLYYGLYYISSPKDGKEYFKQISTLPEVKSWEPPKKEGDQPEFHKYLAYMEVFAPSKLEEGLKVLEKRMEPMFMSRRDYDQLRAEQPNMPSYRDAIRSIVNNDIHLKYFWLIKLIESPSKFEREFAKLNINEAKEVAKWIDPERYVYLVELVWLKDTVERYGDAVPALMDTLTVDLGLYRTELDKLKAWCWTKSRLLRKFRRGKRLASAYLREPSNVLKALDKALEMANRYALLAKNIENFSEAVISTHMGAAMEDLKGEMNDAQTESYAKHVDGNNERIRMEAGFKKEEWETLTQEFEKTAANAEWYAALSARLANRRLDCRKIEFKVPEDWDQYVKEQMPASN